MDLLFGKWQNLCKISWWFLLVLFDKITKSHSSPPIIAPCFLGIDMPTKKDLISANMNNKELAVYLGVDSLDFLSVPNLIEILGSQNHCFGCFTEKYPVEKELSKDEFYQKKIEYWLFSILSNILEQYKNWNNEKL